MQVVGPAPETLTPVRLSPMNVQPASATRAMTTAPATIHTGLSRACFIVDLHAVGLIAGSATPAACECLAGAPRPTLTDRARLLRQSFNRPSRSPDGGSCSGNRSYHCRAGSG